MTEDKETDILRAIRKGRLANTIAHLKNEHFYFGLNKDQQAALAELEAELEAERALDKL